MDPSKIVIATKTEEEKEQIDSLLSNLSEEDKKDLLLASQKDLDDSEESDNISQKSVYKILKEQTNLKQNDIIIHTTYGLGRFLGLETITFQNVKSDFIKLQYAEQTTLLIPIQNIDLVTKYSNANPNAKLDKLGASKWLEKKNRVLKKIKDISKQLIKLASQRKLIKAPIFTQDKVNFEKFCQKFEFDLTKDQKAAFKSIEKDLASGTPMDRLLCGDVGYGKTEVAIMASFLVASSGYQVIVITPTTLLCQQHYKNFTKRYEGYNIKIGCLSSINSPTTNTIIKEKIKKGDLDIIIGTHALLNSKIEYKNLGLIIVDEEQKFGVKQKEKIKDFRVNTHILSMSATPIPRTLQMSITGIRELSVISTPPKNRLNVQTVVCEDNDDNIIRAINFELSRNGKVFFVVPRIQDIVKIEARIQKNLPNLKYVVIHGQMETSKSDKLMTEFYEGKYQIMICTTIIENGIDIPNTNTMLIYKADTFGLAQLYQLRGRVGRTNIQGYTYLLKDKNRNLSDTSNRRLEIIASINSLNAGFKIASEDMEIRGTGNIIGVEQSGHIKEVGIELYTQMLNDAIQNEKHHDMNINKDFSPEIKCSISTSIPDTYIEDPIIKMSFYRRIAAIETVEEKLILKKEMQKRFGEPCSEIENLFEITLLKAECKKLNIAKIQEQNKKLFVTFYNDYCPYSNELVSAVLNKQYNFEIKSSNTLIYQRTSKGPIRDLQDLITTLSNFNKN